MKKHIALLFVLVAAHAPVFGVNKAALRHMLGQVFKAEAKRVIYKMMPFGAAGCVGVGAVKFYTSETAVHFQHKKAEQKISEMIEKQREKERTKEREASWKYYLEEKLLSLYLFISKYL